MTSEIEIVMNRNDRQQDAACDEGDEMVEPQIADQLSRTISTELRSAYHALLTKPVPDRFAQLLAELEKHPSLPSDGSAATETERAPPRPMAKDRST